MSYEGKMARSSLRKNIVYSNELLSIIKPEQELEAWVQDKISLIDHNIESIYGFYRFGENETSDSDKSYDEEEQEECEICVGAYKTRYFFMCPSAKNLYKYIIKIGVSEKLAQQSAQLQDLLYYIEHLAINTNLASDMDVTLAEMLSSNIMTLAEEMQLEKQHDYISSHLETIKRINSDESSDEDMTIVVRED